MIKKAKHQSIGVERGSKLIEFKSRISKMNNRQLKQYVEILKTELIKRKNK